MFLRAFLLPAEDSISSSTSDSLGKKNHQHKFHVIQISLLNSSFMYDSVCVKDFLQLATQL